MMGSLSRLGLDFISALMFSLLLCSATAQAVTLGLWAASPPVAAMMLAVVATNSRYLVMSAHLRQLFPDMPRRAMLPILAWLGDASWMMTIAEAERARRDAGYLLGSSLPMNIGWIGGTALGYALPLETQGPLAVAAAFLPLAFVVTLLPTQWRGRRSLLPWAVSGAGLAVAALGPNWAMLLGGGAGTLVSALRGDDARLACPRRHFRLSAPSVMPCAPAAFLAASAMPAGGLLASAAPGTRATLHRLCRRRYPAGRLGQSDRRAAAVTTMAVTLAGMGGLAAGFGAVGPRRRAAQSEGPRRRPEARFG